VRSGRRLSLTPVQFRLDERAQAARAREQLVAELKRARDRGDEWYVWIRDVWGPRRRRDSDRAELRARSDAELGSCLRDELVDRRTTAGERDLPNETKAELVDVPGVLRAQQVEVAVRECSSEEERESVVDGGDARGEVGDLHGLIVSSLSDGVRG
jgi:hypothetical protein